MAGDENHPVSVWPFQRNTGAATGAVPVPAWHAGVGWVPPSGKVVLPPCPVDPPPDCLLEHATAETPAAKTMTESPRSVTVMRMFLRSTIRHPLRKGRRDRSAPRRPMSATPPATA